jgi:HEAT repeat protein
MALIKSTTSRTRSTDERKHPRDLAGLIAQLDDPSPKARRWAARDLTDHPTASAALASRLGREEDASVREILLTTLTSLGDELAVAALVDCLRSDDAALRNEAVEAMKQLPDEVAPIMGGLLRDADPDVRIFAVNILESLRHPEVESWLLAVLDRDEHLNVCATAVDLLGEVGSAAAKEPLLRLKARYAEEPYIQFATDLALQRLGEP